jgi:hypothetical protein
LNILDALELATAVDCEPVQEAGLPSVPVAAQVEGPTASELTAEFIASLNTRLDKISALSETDAEVERCREALLAAKKLAAVWGEPVNATS